MIFEMLRCCHHGKAQEEEAALSIADFLNCCTNVAPSPHGKYQVSLLESYLKDTSILFSNEFKCSYTAKCLRGEQPLFSAMKMH